MADALVAQQMGKRYQAWLFWEYASQLLLPSTNVVEVRFEDGVRAFDDVVVRFDPPRLSGYQEWVTHRNLQAKYHIGSGGEFNIECFTNPGFIGATDATLLSRLGDAYRTLGSDDFLRRDFWIVSPWALRSDDWALAELWRENTQGLNPTVLAQGKQRNSRWVNLRAKWREATGASSDDELLAMIGRLRLGYSYGGVAERYAEILSARLHAVGLRPIEPYAMVEPYSEIPWNLHAQKHTRYTRADIQRIAELANLLLPPPNRPAGARLGVRSRVEWGDHMEAECQALLPLEDLFEGRALREGVTWADVYRRVHDFLRSETRLGARKLLELAAPITVAFAAGFALPTRDGRPVFPLQRFRGGEALWDATEPDSAAGGWEVHRDETTGTGGADVAVGLALSRDVWKDMHPYVQRACPEIGRIIELRTPVGPGPGTVRGAGHAVHLAVEAERYLRELRAASGARTAHLFLSVPNGFAYLLGQEGERLGSCQLYEFDLSAERDGSYQPSLRFPDDTRLTAAAPRTSESQ
jgi:hypothetical protein